MREMFVTSFIGAIVVLLHGFMQAGPLDFEQQQVSRMVQAEAGCEPFATKRAIAYVIISSAKNAGLKPSQAIFLDNGHYLSSYMVAKNRGYSEIYFSDFAAFRTIKCALSTADAVSSAFNISSIANLYHFDNYAPSVSWKRGMIEFRVDNVSSMYFYAKTEKDKEKFLEELK